MLKLMSRNQSLRVDDVDSVEVGAFAHFRDRYGVCGAASIPQATAESKRVCRAPASIAGPMMEGRMEDVMAGIDPWLDVDCEACRITTVCLSIADGYGSWGF